jgi:hypothetical protein
VKRWATATRGGRSLNGGIAEWAPPGLKVFYKIQNQLKLVNSKWTPATAPKIFKLCMRLDLNIPNNFLSWVDFIFPTELML